MHKYYEGEAIVKAFTETTNQSATWARGILASMEEADVVPVVHGHWVAGKGLCYPNCSVCNNYSPDGEDWTFCPWCGAKMDEGVKHNEQ